MSDRMSDVEITRLCAKAMGYAEHHHATDKIAWTSFDGAGEIYDPLHDDAQAMALVKRFHLSIAIWDSLYESESGWWRVDRQQKTAIGPMHATTTRNKDLNRAVCECVAAMQKAK